MSEEATKAIIQVSWKKPKDIERWEEAATALGYPNANDCIRDLAEEARTLKLAELKVRPTANAST